MKDFSTTALREDLKKALPEGHGYSEQIDRALKLAFRAHKGQAREHRDGTASRLPYIVHPVGVAKLAASYWRDGELPDGFDDVISAALTHDVLEDSEVDLTELEKSTSRRAAEIVLALTKPRLSIALPREARNESLVEQIADAGPTARYLKICDAMHNLTRAQTIPTKLLRKTVRRAADAYLPLAQGQLFEARLGGELKRRIHDAEQQLKKDVQRARPLDGFDLDQVLSYCIRQAHLKVLEDHDIADLVAAMPGVKSATVMTSAEFERSQPHQISSPNGSTRRPIRLDTANESGEFSLAATSLHEEDTDRNVGDRVVFAVLSRSDEWQYTKWLFAEVLGEEKPTWFTPNSLFAIVSVLSERLRSRETRELAEYGATLAHFGLQLEPKLAQHYALTQTQMLGLRRFLDAGSFVHRNLRTALELMMRQEDNESVDRVESRVKSAASSIVKASSRKLLDYREIDDLVGVRLVFASRRSRDRFVANLERELAQSGGEIARIVRIMPNSMTKEQIHSSDGYCAVHIRFQAESPAESVKSVPCEIQLRTIFEDAWARFSHLSTYKKKNSPMRTSRLLKELAKLRDDCDERISRNF